MADRKSDQRKRDEACMKYAGLMGHTIIEVADTNDAPPASCTRGQYGDIAAALRHKDKGSRLYQIVKTERGKRKYNRVG